MPTPANIPFEHARATDFDPVGVYLATQKARQDMQIQREQQALREREQKFAEDEARVARERDDAKRQREAAEKVNALIAAGDTKGAEAVARINGIDMALPGPAPRTAAQVEAVAADPNKSPATELDFILAQGGIPNGPQARPPIAEDPYGAAEPQPPENYSMVGRFPIPTQKPTLSSSELDRIASGSPEVAAVPSPQGKGGKAPQAQAGGPSPWGAPATPPKAAPDLEDLMLQSLSTQRPAPQVDPSTTPSRYEISAPAFGTATSTATGEAERLALGTESRERDRFMGRVEDFGRKIMANLTPADAANEGMIAADIQAIREMARVIPLNKQDKVLEELEFFISRRDMNDRAAASAQLRKQIASISAGRANAGEEVGAAGVALRGRQQAVQEARELVSQRGMKAAPPGEFSSFEARTRDAEKAVAAYQANPSDENRKRMQSATVGLRQYLLTADQKGVLTDQDRQYGDPIVLDIFDKAKNQYWDQAIHGSNGVEIARQIAHNARRVQGNALARYKSDADAYRAMWQSTWSSSPSLGEEGAKYIESNYKALFGGIPGIPGLSGEITAPDKADQVRNPKGGGSKKENLRVSVPVSDNATPEEIKAKIKAAKEAALGDAANGK